MKYFNNERFIQRIDKLMSFPGIDDNTLTFKKNEWLATIGSTIAITGMTLLAWSLHMPILVSYGQVLLSTCVIALVVVPFMRKYIERLFFAAYLVNILASFYFMLELGGLLNSAGLLFTGISVLFISINLQNARMTISLFVVYLFTLVITAILQPWLTIAPEMSTSKNLLFFTLNCSWQAGFTVMLVLNNMRQKKNLAEAKQAESIRLEELDEVKTKLFTNITHEFRTPLTIILGMARLVKEKPDEWLEEGTNKIQSSGQNLLRLVNQMLDLSKLEAGAMQVHIFKQDIILNLRFLCESLSSLALSKNIQLKFIPGTDHFLMDFDAEKIMHIVTNLLSNALKYTQAGGEVIMTAGVSTLVSNEFVIKVQDNGPGIPEEHLPYIFNRFYRIDDDAAQFQTGSGLGLALTKELVKLMGGNIYVESSPEKGTTFTITFAVSQSAPFREIGRLSELKENISGMLPNPGKDRLKPANVEIPDSERPILLVVEDSPDLVEYLDAILKCDYHLEVATNGREGLQKAFEYIPDIILSDVMMPGMDGISMLEKLKSDERTSHIPVVLLTAKADIASKLTGLESGADDYLAKPFSEEELLVRLKKLIENRKRLRDRYTSMGALPITEDKAIRAEDAFMLKVRSLMETHLDDDHFGILELCKEIGMSRAQLYRKFKCLTDKTVNDYLLTIRLYKAKEMLLKTDLNVSEVAYEVGFKNLSHFSRVFTGEFGKNPSELRK